MNFFRPNIQTFGRILRAVGALALIVAAFLVWPHSVGWALVLLGGAAFMAFEAARGWCALRACGLKTKF